MPAGLKIANQIIREGDVTLPRAPKTILNGPIGGARRFAAQSWEIDRIQRVAKSSATTLNDVVLAMVSGALREYLLEQHALPDEPMTAMVPVSLALRAESAGKDTGTGNAAGAIIVNLATDRDQGATRLEEIAYSSRQAKKIIGDLTPTQILAFSALQVLPLALTPIPGFVKYTHPPFNVIVSNVPGPKKEMYFNGSRLDGMYPGLDRDRRPRPQHHADESRRLPRLRPHRLPPKRPSPAATADAPRDVTGRAREGLGLIAAARCSDC